MISAQIFDCSLLRTLNMNNNPKGSEKVMMSIPRAEVGEGGEQSGLISIDNVCCFSSMNFDIALEGRKDSVQSQPRQSNTNIYFQRQNPKVPKLQES